MSQPNRLQWIVICVAALVVVVGWPPDRGHSLGVKAINWLADPAGALPSMPPALPRALDDDGDAVAEYDAQAREYYRAAEKAGATRWRMRLKEMGEPLDPMTERQLLIGVGVLSALLVWRLSARRSPDAPPASS
jgi:hypothetical protein